MAPVAYDSFQSVSGNPDVANALAGLGGSVVPGMTGEDVPGRTGAAAAYENYWAPIDYRAPLGRRTLNKKRGVSRSGGSFLEGIGNVVSRAITGQDRYGTTTPTTSSATPFGDGMDKFGRDKSAKAYNIQQKRQSENETARLQEGQDADREQLRAILRVVLGREPTPQEMQEAWEEGLDAMEAAEAMGEDPMDPFHWLQEQQKAIEAERAAKGLDPKTGLPLPVEPRTVTETNIRTALTDPQTARVLINKMAYNAIGRELTDEEQAAFAASLNAAEKDNPITTVTETDIGPDEVDPTREQVRETRTTETGQAINPSAFAEESIDDKYEGEKKDYWDDTTGTQVLMQLISGF